MYLGYRHSYPSREKRIVRTNLPERRFSAHDKNLLVSFDQKMDDAFRPCRVPPRGSIQVKRLYSKSLPFHFSSLPLLSLLESLVAARSFLPSRTPCAVFPASLLPISQGKNVHRLLQSASRRIGFSLFVDAYVCKLKAQLQNFPPGF